MKNRNRSSIRYRQGVFLLFLVSSFCVSYASSTDKNRKDTDFFYDSLFKKTHYVFNFSVDSAFALNNQYIRIAISQNNTYGKGLGYLQKAYLHLRNNDYPEAYSNLEISRAFMTRNVIPFLKAFFHHVEGLLYYRLEEYDKSTERILSSLAQFKKQNDSLWICNNLVQLTKIKTILNKKDEAFSYLKSAERWVTPYYQYVYYINLAELCNSFSQPGEALSYCELAVQSVKKNYSSVLIHKENSILWALYNWNKYLAFKRLDKKDSLNYYFEKSNSILAALGKNTEITFLLSTKASDAREKGDYRTALRLYHQALDSITENEKLSVKSSIYYGLSECYKELGDYKSALCYYDTYKIMSDSLSARKSADRASLVELQNQYERKMSSMEQERQSSAERSKFRVSIFLISIMSIFCIAFILFRYLYKKQLLQRKEAELRRMEKEQELLIEQAKLIQAQIQNTRAYEQVNEFASQMKRMAPELPVNQRVQLMQQVNELKKNQQQDTWKAFQDTFEKQYPYFCNQLIAKAPHLTANEIRVCTLIKMEIPSKEIANVMGVTKDTVKTYRKRIRNKLKIGEERGALDLFILSI